jgi:hypothetical protein
VVGAVGAADPAGSKQMMYPVPTIDPSDLQDNVEPAVTTAPLIESKVFFNVVLPGGGGGV